VPAPGVVEMTRAILFDLDGVLVDSKAAWLAALNQLRREAGRPDVRPEEFEQTWGQSTADDAGRFFGGMYTEAELSARYEQEFARHLHAVRRIEPDVDRALDRLRKAGFLLAVTTNAPRGTADDMLAVTRLSALFATVVTPDDVAVAKPAPDMLLAACRRLGVPASDAILVGDTIVDAIAGQAAGIPVIGYRMPGTARRIERLDDLLTLLGPGS